MLLPGKPIHYPLQQPLNVLLFVTALGFGAIIVLDPASEWAYWGLVAVASVLGVTLTLPIGGADMPVAIALLNSYSGIAAAATGFVLSNNALIITGSLVGASGIILTRIMCRAMNRSLMNVLLGKVGAGDTGGATADEVYAGKVKSASAEEVAMVLESARSVIIVPGYGMAVAQAQHALREMADELIRLAGRPGSFLRAPLVLAYIAFLVALILVCAATASVPAPTAIRVRLGGRIAMGIMLSLQLLVCTLLAIFYGVFAYCATDLKLHGVNDLPRALWRLADECRSTNFKAAPRSTNA